MTNKKTEKATFNRKSLWDKIYSENSSMEVSWYQQHPEISLKLIRSTGVDLTARIIDVGGGTSTLVDYLLDAGYENLEVLDISHSAIEQTRSRLNRRADKVIWHKNDITKFSSNISFDVWHDRAVFHFLTDKDDRAKYVRALSNALKSGSHAIIATFDLDGPEKCSGLNIVRYSSEALSDIFGDAFQLVETRTEEHVTPSGIKQSFVYCRFVRL